MKKSELKKLIKEEVIKEENQKKFHMYVEKVKNSVKKLGEVMRSEGYDV